MKTCWQFQFADWLCGSKYGVRLYGFRRNARGRWLRAEEVPERVREFFHVEKTPGAANNWACPSFKTVAEFKEKAHAVKFQRCGGRLVKGIALIETFPEPRVLETLPCMKSHCDGAHCGLTDWYPEIELGIQCALRRGRDTEWTTGWYGSKKEIASACIIHADRQIQVQVSVSDDFDTEGLGECVIPHTVKLDKLRNAISKAWDQALSNQRDNRMYLGFTICKDNKCLDYLILPSFEAEDWESPPGDCYSSWGFQDEEAIPEEVRKRLSAWAEKYKYEQTPLVSYTYQGYTIKPWEE